ncbi:MAG TPA: efflux transporter outer membrane subunit [Steroidobacteraceae bacterium]|nr:efflux transporter outer membrane subunit [Steroidobacteraceae bacterium]
MRVVGCMLLAALLAGCVLPQREDPAGTLIEQQSLGLEGGSPLQPIDVDWWKAFNDPQLDALMDEALRDSPTLAQALARVRLAQSRVQSDVAANQPRFAIDADETWQRFSENYYIPPPFAGQTMWIGQATANMHWDIDFWGRQAALIRQSRSQAVASALDVASARLALAGAVTQAYVDLYRSWELVDIATRTQEQREQLLKLTQQRTAAGLDTQIELKIAQSTVPQARALRLQAEAARDIAVHRLAALIGTGADRYAQLSRPKLTLDATLPLPDQLPIDLLAHRPDVLAARERVEAATAGRAAAHAAFYPNISLTALVGMQAIGLEELTESGSRIYGIGPAFHLPIFDAQRLRAAYKGATAELDAATASYNGAVLDAVREASDQVTLNASLTQQIAEVRATLDAASSAHELAERRYAAGLTTQIIVLDAESRVLDARRALVTADSNRLLARMNLLLMLGGSFDPAAPLAAAGAGAP